ncbi:MAG: hypothetical protein AAFY00_09445 [Bacteroidota bacterium]
MRKYRKRSSIGWLVTIHRTETPNLFRETLDVATKASLVQKSLLDQSGTHSGVYV